MLKEKKKLNVMVVGGGGREHAIVRTLARSPQVEKLWCAPGNSGIAQDADCAPVQADDMKALFDFAKSNKIDLTMVGPEAALVMGIVDKFRKAGMAIVGPTQQAACLEGSKSFAKKFMQKYGIPTAKYDVLLNLQQATHVLRHWTGRSVVKADGIAAGKGVKVCETQDEAKAFLYEIMEKEIFGAAGSTVVIEEALQGPEVTLMAFCDGKTLVTMPPSQDHKRVYNDDRGPNTGGMGAYAPAPVYTAALKKQVEEEVCKPFLKGLIAEKLDFRGIIYFGLMLTPQGPKVLEFNTRFGDPETQVVLPLLETDFVDILKAVAEQRLSEIKIEWRQGSALCVVLASGGYPGPFEKGKAIHGLDKAAQLKDVQVFHAGTTFKNNQWSTAGGRVLGVTGVAGNFEQARDLAYQAVSHISFEAMHYRKDIGAKAMALAGKR